VVRDRGDLDRVADNWFDRNPALARLWSASRPAGPWKAVAGVRVETSTPRLPGILYAGDCQGTIDPLGGQGMTMALLGAELLAPIVTRALVHGGVDAALQRAYASAWHRRFDRRIALCRLFHQAFVNPSWVDVAGTFRTLAPRVLAACFDQTRDRCVG
jgi:flavin-dependent dehydrogenase